MKKDLIKHLIYTSILLALALPLYAANYVPGEILIILKETPTSATQIDRLDQLPGATQGLATFLGARSISQLYKEKDML